MRSAKVVMAKMPPTAQELVEEYDGASVVCPYTHLLEVLGRPHTLQIIYVLQKTSPWRFTQVQKILHIQPKTLAARLQELLELGLVTRKAYNEKSLISSGLGRTSTSSLNCRKSPSDNYGKGSGFSLTEVMVRFPRELDVHVKMYGVTAEEFEYTDETCPTCDNRIDSMGWCGHGNIGGD
jgi:DNA-binding HxlR family transcriptional regulator